MRLERREATSLPDRPLSPVLLREARAEANAWLARFTPLLEEPGTLAADECRRRLDLLAGLGREGEGVLSRLEAQAGAADAELAGTLRAAVEHLPVVEEDLRRRLAFLAPGDPAAAVDLALIRSRIAEADARHEVESLVGTSGQSPVPRLEQRTSAGSPAAAVGMGVACVGMLSFVTLHATLMIGGLAHVFGPGALALLPFYGIFYAAAGGLGWQAVRAGCRETLELQGRELTLKRELGPWKWEKRFTLARESRAHVTVAAVRQQGSMPTEVSVQDQEGRDVRFAAGRPTIEQERLVARINEFLEALR